MRVKTIACICTILAVSSSSHCHDSFQEEYSYSKKVEDAFDVLTPHMFENLAELSRIHPNYVSQKWLGEQAKKGMNAYNAIAQCAAAKVERVSTNAGGSDDGPKDAETKEFLQIVNHAKNIQHSYAPLDDSTYVDFMQVALYMAEMGEMKTLFSNIDAQLPPLSLSSIGAPHENEVPVKYKEAQYAYGRLPEEVRGEFAVWLGRHCAKYNNTIPKDGHVEVKDTFLLTSMGRSIIKACGFYIKVHSEAELFYEGFTPFL